MSGGISSPCASSAGSLPVAPSLMARPVSSSKSITPTEYKSARTSTARPAACSGAMYSGVPITAPTWVPLPAAPRRAMPKSSTRAKSAPSGPLLTKIFSGLMSR